MGKIHLKVRRPIFKLQFQGRCRFSTLVGMTSIHDIPVTLNDGTHTTMSDWAGHLVMVVNVASRCGLTPQYEGLQRIFEDYQDRGFFVVGVPCNQFMEQEPGTAAEICSFTQDRFNVTFPLLAKTDVNGENEHPLYTRLKEHQTAEGRDGDVEWNFEKFLINADGETIARFGPRVDPEDDVVIAVIEDNLPV